MAEIFLPGSFQKFVSPAKISAKTNKRSKSYDFLKNRKF
jgi:hypothetical protein